MKAYDCLRECDGRVAEPFSSPPGHLFHGNQVPQSFPAKPPTGASSEQASRNRRQSIEFIAKRSLLLSLLRDLLSNFLHAKLDHSLDQREWNRPAQWKLHRSLCVYVILQLGAESFNRRRGRIESNVFLKSSKMHQVFLQNESRHPILQGFLRVRRRLSDYRPDFLKRFLNVSRESRNVFVNIVRCSGFHIGQLWLKAICALKLNDRMIGCIVSIKNSVTEHCQPLPTIANALTSSNPRSLMTHPSMSIWKIARFARSAYA
jgi:hypothetical protein